MDNTTILAVHYNTQNGVGHIACSLFEVGSIFSKRLAIIPKNSKKFEKLGALIRETGIEPFEIEIEGKRAYEVPVAFANVYREMEGIIYLSKSPSGPIKSDKAIGTSFPNYTSTPLNEELRLEESSQYVSPRTYQQRVDAGNGKRKRQNSPTAEAKEQNSTGKLNLQESERSVIYVLNTLNNWDILNKIDTRDELVVKIPKRTHHTSQLLGGEIAKGLNRLRIFMDLDCAEDLTYINNGNELHITPSGQKLIRLGAKKYGMMP